MLEENKLVIGVDEAGYGPSMGPLTICATAWRVPHSFDVTSMSELLEPEFIAKPIRPDSIHIPIGDSKKINRDRFGIEGLCLGSRFLCFEVDGVDLIDWDRTLYGFASHDWTRIQDVPWYALGNPSSDDRLGQLVADRIAYFDRGSQKLRSLSLRLIGIRMRVLDEPEFNRQVDIIGNKSSVLSETSLMLVRDVIATFAEPDESVEVYCDKHGGRNRYQGVLSHCFEQEWFAIEVEGKNCSRYTSSWRGHPIRIQFKVDGDSIFPSAAASIIAKWTREELMGRLNGFWRSKVSNGIEPTAGYYVDALRFAEQIESTAIELELCREKWWRKK